MNQPLVSVLMAAKNYGRFIAQAVESVFVQTYPHWELIIINDGSTDDTATVLSRWQAESRVQVVHSDRLGQPRAKNLAYRLSRGDLLAYLDADDAWRPNKLALQVERFQQNAALGVCSTDRLLMNEAGELRSVSPVTVPTGDPLPQVFLKNHVCFSSVMVRRTVLDHVGSFDPHLDLAIDYDQWLRVAEHHSFEHVAEPLVLYRTGHGNLSKKLLDRVSTAEVIMNRALARPGATERIGPSIAARGYAETFNTLGYVLRISEPRRALHWYTRALSYRQAWLESLRGTVAALWQWCRGQQTPGTPENAHCNQ
jgi:glycosyltransferase involved in cell wall biosynthesis